jgi:hypothetical protein
MTGPDGDLIPRDLFSRLVVTPGDVIDKYEDFHLVAIRFDLCDRKTPGNCPVGEDGMLRLVFQPMFLESSSVDAQDVALHAFYPIPAAELATVINELRELARITFPIDGRLSVTNGLESVEYTMKLRLIVLRYAKPERLKRLTLFAQNIMTASFNWAFRGVELDAGGTFVDIVIPTVMQTQQRAILVGMDTTYDTTPLADVPAGFANAIDATKFGAATADGRRIALEAMTAVQNPLEHTASTVQCVACHVSTFLTAHRATAAGINPTTIAGRYTSLYDLSISAGKSAFFDRSLRAFGWFFAEPAISQRVVNDTAQTLAEIEIRFPTP